MPRVLFACSYARLRHSRIRVDLVSLWLMSLVGRQGQTRMPYTRSGPEGNRANGQAEKVIETQCLIRTAFQRLKRSSTCTEVWRNQFWCDDECSCSGRPEEKVGLPCSVHCRFGTAADCVYRSIHVDWPLHKLSRVCLATNEGSIRTKGPGCIGDSRRRLWRLPMSRFGGSAS